MGESFDWNAKSPCQSEICYFQVTMLINEQILRFEVSVYDSPRMAVVEPIDDLKHEKFNVVRRQTVLVLREVLLQVVVHILEDQLKLFFRRNIDNLL